MMVVVHQVVVVMVLLRLLLLWLGGVVVAPIAAAVLVGLQAAVVVVVVGRGGGLLVHWGTNEAAVVAAAAVRVMGAQCGRLADGLEARQSLRERRQAPHIVVYVIDLVILLGYFAAAQDLLLGPRVAAGTLPQHIPALRQPAGHARRRRQHHHRQPAIPTAELGVLLLLLAQLEIHDLEPIACVCQQALGLVEEARVLDKVLQLLHVLGPLQLYLRVQRHRHQVRVLLQWQGEDPVDLDAPQQPELWDKWLLEALGRTPMDKSVKKTWEIEESLENERDQEHVYE